MGGPAGSVWDGNPDAYLGSLYSFLDVQHMRGGRASSFLWKSDRISGRYPAAFGNLPVEKEKTAKNFNEFVIADNRTYVFEGSTTVSLNGSEILYIELEQTES